MHGTVPAVLSFQESDLLIVLGARFDDRVTGKPSEFAPHAEVIHVDIDPAEIGKIRHAEVPIVGDVKEVLQDLSGAFAESVKAHTPDYAEWWERLNLLREQFPLGYDEPDDGLLSPQGVIKKIGEMSVQKPSMPQE